MQRGSPIRTPSDHRLFTNSPRLIAGHHVLHRLLIPRHPPCALTHSPHLKTCSKPDNTQQQTITTIIHQMLASTIHKQKQQQEKHTTVCSPTTQQRAHPHATYPIQRAHNTRTQHTTTVHCESFCDVPPKNKHHTNTCGLPTQTGGCSLERR